jgi:cob(I)alamin adenosyltransferase
MWFSYDHENGIEFYLTEERAKAAAERAFGYDKAEEKGGVGGELDVADCAVTLEEARGVIRRMEKRIAKLEKEKMDWVAVGKG